MNVEKMQEIIMYLQPDMSEFADNASFDYWMDYACELDTLSLFIQASSGDNDALVSYINKVMSSLTSDKPSHHACVDVATTFEEVFPELKGEFVYG